MSTDLTERPSSFFVPVNIDPINDSYVIRGGAGVAVAHVKKPSGEVFSAHVKADGAFQQMTYFDPSKLSLEERRSLEFDLYEKDHSQAEIADLLGVSQPTVSADLRIMRRLSSEVDDPDKS